MKSFGDNFFSKPAAGVDDMISLKELEQHHLMSNLEARFRQEAVYTYIGDIVVSVNPFKDTGNSTPEVQQRYVQAYKKRESPTKLPPHVYMLIGQAYAQMRDGTSKSLSVLISGESGAGKTEAMKLCVSHLGAVSDASQGRGGGSSSSSMDDADEGNVAMRLMKTNPIMEPIGNAKTVRNNNSSRFGKHFDIQFSRDGNIVGANTSVYLLEKPRITNHMKGERNYHIFYMLCKAPESVRKYGLLEGDEGEDLWAKFKVLSQPGTVEQVTSWNDVKEFVKMHQALHDLGFSSGERGQLYAMIGIVLHLGNVEFVTDEESEDGGVLVSNEPQYLIACELLQIDPEVFRNALTNELVTFGKETMQRKLSKTKTDAARNSLCMQIYQFAFEWCVKKINETIAQPEHEVFRCIGVLDIFGFENFDSLNSFPQLCINLTNEKLHHLFIEHIFEVEQRFYESEGVEWQMVAYEDNQPIINLIVKKPGIFSVVNDACQQSKMGAGGVTDESLLMSMNAAFDKKAHEKIYAKPKKPNTFIIHHYAGSVLYTIDGFIEKNKDELGPSIAAVLNEHTKFERLKRLALDFKKRMEMAVLDKQAAAAAGGGGKKGKGKGGGDAPQRQTRQKTVSESFGESLSSLMDKLSATDHAYIRCLKSNHTLKAGDWNSDLMLKQLAYSGTLEVCKVRKAGLTVRKPLAKFYDWYKITAKNMRQLRAPSVREQCKLLLQQLPELDPQTWRVGKTLVFLASFDVITLLDTLREARVADYARLIWSYWKMRNEWREYKHARKLIINLQNVYRGVRTKKAYRELRDKTRILQHAGLVKIARERVKDLRDVDLVREEPGLLEEYIPDVDEMVNTDTNEVLSLTRAVAANMFPHAAKLSDLTKEEVLQLEAKRKELRKNPEALIAEAGDAALVTLVYQNMLWQRSGAHVSVGGQVGLKNVAKVDEKPTVPKFKTAENGGAVGWLTVQIEPRPDGEDDGGGGSSSDYPGLAEAYGGSGGGGRRSKRDERKQQKLQRKKAKRSGGGRYSLQGSYPGSGGSFSTASQEARSPSHQMYATLRQGTLALEELIEVGSPERVAVRTCPMALWRVVGVYPAAFGKADIGKQVRISGDKVYVGGEERPLTKMIRVTAADAKLRAREEIVGVMQTGQEIIRIDDYVGGKVMLRDPSKPDNLYFFHNPEPGGLAKGEARLVLEQERTLVWEGANVKDANELGRAQVRDRGFSVLGFLPGLGGGRRGTVSAQQAVTARAKPLPSSSSSMPDAAEAEKGWLSWMSGRNLLGRGNSGKSLGERAPSVSPLIAPSREDGGGTDGEEDDAFKTADEDEDEEEEEEEDDEEKWQKDDEDDLLVRERIYLRPADYMLDNLQRKMPCMQFHGESEVGYLQDLAAHINESIVQSARIDDFVVQPPPSKEELEALVIMDEAETKQERVERMKTLRESRNTRKSNAKARESITPNAIGVAERSDPGGGGGGGGGGENGGGGGGVDGASRPGLERDVPTMPNVIDPNRTKKERGVLREGFLMRKLHPKGQWGRRYFVLYKDGQLKWFTDHDEAEHEPQLAARRRLDLYGQATLRFFAVCQLADPDAETLKHEAYEDNEQELMLASCTHFELRSGSQALHLAWHHAIADEWIQLLSLQCLLCYQKSPVFSDKFVPIQWPDGEVRSEYVGENTTTTDVVKRQCRSRKRHIGPGLSDYGPLVMEPADWALFERQKHEQSERSLYASKAEMKQEVNAGTDHINLARSPLHKLPAGEPILDQLLLRWEGVARREYGVAISVPKDAFQLQLRKTRTRGIKGVSKEEQQLEFWQARDDLLDGRLLRCLGRKEMLELACVLALWEMHDRGPRGGHSLQVALRNLRLQKHKNPTLEFDVRPDELYLVLPPSCLQTEKQIVKSFHDLKSRYKLLIKDKSNAPTDPENRVTSETWKAVHDVRSESIGVQYDSHGQVVVDKTMAERIIRYRLSREPLSFGAQYSVRVWSGVALPLRTAIAAINGDGIHLYSWDRDPLPIASIKFEWDAENTIVGWQGVEHEYNDDAERAVMEAHLEDHDYIGHTSLVVHTLTPSISSGGGIGGGGGGGLGEKSMFASEEMSSHPGAGGGGGGGDASSGQLSSRLRAGHRHASLKGSLSMLNLNIGAVPQGASAGARPSARGGGGGGMTARDRRSKEDEKPKIARQRAKLILLTTEGQDMEAMLATYAQEHVTKVRQRRLAAKQRGNANNANARAALQTGVMMLRDTVAESGGGLGGKKWGTAKNLLAASSAMGSSGRMMTMRSSTSRNLLAAGGGGANGGSSRNLLGGGMMSARPQLTRGGGMTSR